MNETELNEVIGGKINTELFSGKVFSTTLQKAGTKVRAFAQCVGDPIDHLLGTGRYAQDQKNDIHFADVREFNDDIDFRFTASGEF